MKPLRVIFGLFLSLLLSMAAAQDLAPIPALKARVTDLAGMLKPEQQAELEKKLQAHEARTGNQVAILLVKSTAPEVIEQYGIRVAEKWKIGRRGIDDGVILIIAKDNTRDLRRMRLEVGRGAEGVLTDAMSKRILQDVIAPHFRSGDFAGGLDAGITAIHAVLNKEAFPSAPKQPAAAVKDEGGVFVWLIIFFIPLGFLIFIIHTIRSAHTRGWGHTSSGIYLGGGWNSGSSNSDSGSSWSGGGGDFGGGGASGDW